MANMFRITFLGLLLKWFLGLLCGIAFGVRFNQLRYHLGQSGLPMKAPGFPIAPGYKPPPPTFQP